MASPEDVEYVQCQEELNLDLLKEHLLVERVIGQQGRGIGSAEVGHRSAGAGHRVSRGGA